MTAKQNLRRENPNLVPRPAGYLSSHSSAMFRNISNFAAPFIISPILHQGRLIFGAVRSTHHVGASLLAMDANDNAVRLTTRDYQTPSHEQIATTPVPPR